MLAQIKEQFGVLHSQPLSGESIHARVIVIFAKGAISALNATGTSNFVSGKCSTVALMALRRGRSGIRGNLALNSITRVNLREFSFGWQSNPPLMSGTAGSALSGRQEALDAPGRNHGAVCSPLHPSTPAPGRPCRHRIHRIFYTLGDSIAWILRDQLSADMLRGHNGRLRVTAVDRCGQ